MKKQYFFIYLSLVTCFLLVSNISTAQLKDRISINGYSSFEFEYRFSDEGKGDPYGSFDADGFDLVFNFDVTERLRFATDVAWEHGAATEDGLGNVAVEYFFPEYTVFEWLKVRAGKMLSPMGIYNEIHTAKPAFMAVKEPYSTNKPGKFGAAYRYYPRWGAGIAVVGNFQIAEATLDYQVQISNGIQHDVMAYNPFEDDDNTQKAITARIRATPINGLRLGISIYNDMITELDDNDIRQTSRTNFFTYSTTVEYNPNKLGFELEFIKNKTEPSSDLANPHPDNFAAAEHHGFETMIYYTLKDRFTPYLRYEFYDYDLASDLDDNATGISFGINTMISNNFFLKLQYNSYNHQEFAAKYAGMQYTQFQMALVLGF